jgi:aspartate/glutamate racemase
VQAAVSISLAHLAEKAAAAVCAAGPTTVGLLPTACRTEEDSQC